jgi:rhamnulokinase
VLVGQIGPGSLEVREVHRFPNAPVAAGGHLYTDILYLHTQVLAGLRAAARGGRLDAVAIDSWGVDYGLLGPDGSLAANPLHYRDSRTAGVLPRVHARIPSAQLYDITGIQQLPINTLCQLMASDPAELARASTLLLIPDLLAYWLTGVAGAEVTNASTTQLLDVRTREWATGLMERLGLPRHLFPPLRQPGETIGGLLPGLAAESGATAGLPVIAVGSHDTASAVAATPARRDGFAYISCGTWSLVGMELAEPVLTDASRQANFTNEAGLDGTVRFLRNEMGLWLLQEAVHGWEASGLAVSLPALLALAAREPPLRSVIDVDDPVFLTPGDMPFRVAALCRATGQPEPASPPLVVRCILDSLALAHRRAVLDVQRLAGRPADVVHIVGGGARNELLCQLTADACGLPVVAGPAEATAIGNLLMQARALGAAGDGLAPMRELVAATQPLARYLPQGGTAAWAAAAERLRGPVFEANEPGARI